MADSNQALDSLMTQLADRKPDLKECCEQSDRNWSCTPLAIRQFPTMADFRL